MSVDSDQSGSAIAATEEALGRLVGLDWWGHGRLVEMADFAFGDCIEVDGRLGVRTVGDYALHIQAPWKLIVREGVSVDSSEVFESTGEQPWDVENRRDRSLKRIFEEGPFNVEGVEVERPDTVTILLRNEMRLEISPRSDPGEAWRLLERPGRLGAHYVVERLEDGGGEARWE